MGLEPWSTTVILILMWLKSWWSMMKNPALRAAALQDDGEFHKDPVLPPSGEKVYLHNLSLAHTDAHIKREISETEAEIYCDEGEVKSVWHLSKLSVNSL